VTATPYPFSAIVGQPELWLALILNAVDPSIGGVLIRGEKGTAKSTAVRGLASLLPRIDVVAGCPFNCDPDAPDPQCPAGPHTPEAARASRPIPLVELPVGASTERVTGSIDLEAALTQGRRRFEPGLLAAAHRGILYVDEVNLLGDHLVDLLLDAAAMGVNYVERDALSVRHASRFLLVGTMNPEEGELRPQLLDRFGITVEVAASSDLTQRAEVVRRRLAYEADPVAFQAAWSAGDTATTERIVAAAGRLAAVGLGEEMLGRVVSVCAAFGVDGHRGDIVCAKTAMALAAWEGRAEVTLDDVRQAAFLALAHRRRRGPFDQPGIDPEELERALHEDPPPQPPGPGPEGNRPPGGGSRGEQRSSGQQPSANPPAGAKANPGAGGSGPQARAEDPPHPATPGAPPSSGGIAREQVQAPGAMLRPAPIEVAGRGAGALGRRSRALSPQGHPVGVREAAGDRRDLSIPATIRAAAPRQIWRQPSGGGLCLEVGDLRFNVREGREGNLILFLVDASGSMAARRRMEATKGAILSLLDDAYQRRDRVGMITFRGAGAEVLLAATSSVQRANRRLAELPTGGRTPLGAGLQLAARVLAAEAVRDPARRPLLVLVTDGRANAGGPYPVAAALAAAAGLAARGVPGIVVDTEDAGVRLGLAQGLATAMGAPCLRLDELASAPLTRVVRAAAGPAGRRRLAG
jgi:magnesium chelatase subunit D